MTGLSIIITYYKGEKYIFKCLNSILNSFGKSNKKNFLEIIIVIDSIEDSERISKEIQNKYKPSEIDLKILINKKNIGVSQSRNIGLKQSKYQYFTIIDQDDYVLDNYFSVLESNLNGLYSAYIINGYINYENLNRRIPIYFFKPKFNFKSIVSKNTYIYTPGLIIFDSKYVNKSNFFIDTSTKYKGCDDWAAYLNLLLNNQNKKYIYLKNKIFTYSLHSDNYSNNVDEMINSTIAVLDHLKGFNNIDSKNKKLIDSSYLMQQFYLAKDFRKRNTLDLLMQFPKQFVSHYFSSFLAIDRHNRLVFNLRKWLA